MRGRRRQIQVLVTLSLAPGVTATEARRELRSRVNDGACYSLDQEHVRVAKAAGLPRPYTHGVG